MAEGNKRNGAGGAEVVRRRAAAQSAGESMRKGAEAGAEMMDQGGEAAERALHQGTEAMDEMARRGRQAGAEVLRSTGAAAREAAESHAEAVRQGSRAGAEVARRAGEAAREGVGAAAEGGRQLGQSMWAGSEQMARFLPNLGAVPGATPGALFDMPQAFAGFFNDMIRTNLRIGQELFRLANPMAVIEMQQKLVRSYLDAIVASQNTLAGMAQRATEKQGEQGPGRS